MENEPNLIRIDRFIKSRHPTLSRIHVDECIRHRLVSDQFWRPVKKGMRVQSTWVLQDSKLKDHLKSIRATPGIHIPIIHEDEDWVAIDKPAGLPSHPLSLFDTHTVTHWATDRWPSLLDEFPSVQPTVAPHRLDTATSGLLIVAKNRKGYELWRHLFHQGSVQKVYLAECWGHPTWDTRRIESSIAHHPSDRRRMVIDPTGRPALTEVTFISKGSDRCILRAEMSSGITHQIRVHLSSVGLPLVGDSLYDPLSKSRSIAPPFHHLRAVEILAGEVHLKLPAVAF